MNTLKLYPNQISEVLQNGDEVVYCASDFAKPFVLAGKALKIYRELRNKPTTRQELMSVEGITHAETEAILNHFSTIGLLEGTPTPEIQNTSNTRKRKVSFWIHLTDKCNLRCAYCYIFKGKNTISVGVINTLLALIRKETPSFDEVHLKFEGGEPLLKFPLIRYIIRRIKTEFADTDIKFKCSLITNGTLITDEICEFLKEEKFFVSVSLDGLGIYNDARKYPNGKRSVNNVLAGIHKLTEHNIKPYILTVVSNVNVCGLDKLLQYVYERNLGVDLILCRDVDENGNLVLDLDLMKRELVPVLERWCRTPQERLPRIQVSTLSLQGTRNRCCSGGRSYFSIGPKGEVGSCQMTLDKPLLKQLTPDHHISDLSSLYTPVPRQDTCESCVWKYACAGGCDALNRSCIHTLHPSPLCPIIKLVLRQLLSLEGLKIQHKKGDAHES